MNSDLINAIERAFARSAIGFNKVVPTVINESLNKYPPVNVVKTEEGNYVVELALAGYSKDNINISQATNFLVIEGNKEEGERDYLYHGIAARHFRREIPIASGVEVKRAEMRDGILSVELENKQASARQIPVL